MALVDKYAKSGGGFPPIGQGTYPARIVQILDLGTQEDEYKGEKKLHQKLWITFELPDEIINVKGEDKPRWLSSEFTKSTNEKSRLYKVIQAVAPDAEDWTDLMDKGLLVQVGVTSGGKDKFIGAMPAPKGMEVNPLVNPQKYFSMEGDGFDADLVEGLPNFLQEKIKLSPEYRAGVPF